MRGRDVYPLGSGFNPTCGNGTSPMGEEAAPDTLMTIANNAHESLVRALSVVDQAHAAIEQGPAADCAAPKPSSSNDLMTTLRQNAAMAQSLCRLLDSLREKLG
jgi:hypothetical protein